MLLTVLGEYVLPAAGGVWQETLIGALGFARPQDAGSRQALARSVDAAGWLRTEREGRRARMHLTAETAGDARSGAKRISASARRGRGTGAGCSSC